MPKLQVPFNFTPRPYQIPLFEAFDSGFKRLIYVWNRRSGKDKCAMNLMAKGMFTRVGSYFYFFPTYKQGKKILWNGMDKEGFKFLNHIPEAAVVRKDNTEMIIEIANGSTMQVIGVDNLENSIVGTNPVGCIFSEYSLQNPIAWDYIAPILAENGGWAIFEFTPRGENHAFNLLKYAENDPDWFTQVLTVKETKTVPKNVLDKERAQLLQRYGDDSFFQQEYYCSFNAPLQGAYYANQMQQAESEKRITSVPHDSSLEVHTAWDLGMDDATSIWFFQVIGREIRFINYLEQNGEGLQYYMEELKRLKQQYRYSYGTHYLPHDIEVRELGTGKSRKQILQQLGMTNIKTVKRSDIQHGIQQVRNVLSRCWFDREKCRAGINGLKSYRKEYNEQNEVYKSKPLHDKNSHSADSFRMFACGYKDLIHTPEMSYVLNLDPY